MPLPFIIAGLAAVGAAAVGASAQSDAKETNERAQEVVKDAQHLYNQAKNSLEQAKKKTETSLMKLGHAKKNVMETSMNQFLTAYGRIKNIELSESVGLNELKNFTLNEQDVLQLREMSDIYESQFSSGAAGAATGAVIALAASGSLPVVSGALSAAGSALALGEVSMAAGLAGSALSFGAAMTPLAAIVAPAMLFSGISASMKADENLEKARTTYAEAERAAEEMQTSEVLCNAISDRSEMFDQLLFNLNGMFSDCTALLDGVINKKRGIFKKKHVDARKFSEDELKLVAVTRALASAVKAVIDTPILTTDGVVTDESESVYDRVSDGVQSFKQDVRTVKAISYNAKPIPAKVPKKTRHTRTENKAERRLGQPHVHTNLGRNIFALLCGCLLAYLLIRVPTVNVHVLNWVLPNRSRIDSLLLTALFTSSSILMIMDNYTENGFFKLIKKICCLAMGGVFSYFYYACCREFAMLNHHVAWSVGVLIGGLLLLGVCLPDKNMQVNSMRCTLTRISAAVSFYAMALLVYVLLCNVIGMSIGISRIITTVLYALFAFTSAFYFEIE